MPTLREEVALYSKIVEQEYEGIDEVVHWCRSSRCPRRKARQASDAHWYEGRQGSKAIWTPLAAALKACWSSARRRAKPAPRPPAAAAESFAASMALPISTLRPDKDVQIFEPCHTSAFQRKAR